MTIVTSLNHRRVTSPRATPRRAPSSLPVSYTPPRQRLSDCYDECARLDRELKVIESSGHAKLGVFAKPLGEQQRCRMMAIDAKQDAAHHLPDDPIDGTAAPAFVEDDDVTSDPFFHRFYDEAGRSAYEQLLRGRMRALALAKMVFSRESVAYVRAEVELAETYARMNLWKQAHAHVAVATQLLKALDETRVKQQRETLHQLHEHEDDATATEHDCFRRMLAFFYDQQVHGEHPGEITKPELIKEASRWDIDSPDANGDLAFVAIIAPANLDVLFGAAPFLHWQQFLLRMERQSAMFQDYVRLLELRIPETTRSMLRETFVLLDPSQFGVVPLHSLINRLESTSPDDTLDQVCESLRAHDTRVEYPSITWSELVQFAMPRANNSPLVDVNDPARDLRPRLKFLSGRFFLRKGQLDDAMRYLQVAIAEHEQVHGGDSESLVPLYLTLAETLSVRFKQLAVLAQQNAIEVADKWLKTTDGTRRVRAKALDIVELASKQYPGKPLPSKKDAEVQAREELLKEYATLSLVRPDTTTIEDAIELATKAWRIQEATHGRDHITTASVHATLAQIHAGRQSWDECVQSYETAIAIYEAACNGPVPASMWLKLAIAKIYHHQSPQDPARREEAATIYEQIGDFFHSFALEFASSSSTRRESCGQALEAWRQWLAVTSSSSATTMEDQKRVLQKIHDATVDGYGEFAVDAANSGRELAQHLIKMGQLRQAERHLRTAWYVLESHFGPHDRRARKARKELTELTSEIKGAALDDDDGGHEWLTI